MGRAGDGKIGFWAVVAIGVGGMVGGGIFAVLGLAVQLAHGGTPMAFALAGVVALLTTYSYAKLSVAYPSRGGTVTFLDRAFGAGMFTGSLNVLLWLSYVVMLSLYALAFGSYGATFLPETWQVTGKHLLISLSVISITGLNLLSAGLTLIVANTFDLTSISTLGSAGFLLIFSAVNAANARHARETDSRGWISVSGSLACIVAFCALVWQTTQTGPGKLWVLVGMVALAVTIEGCYRLAKREIRIRE